MQTVQSFMDCQIVVITVIRSVVASVSNLIIKFELFAEVKFVTLNSFNYS